MKLHSKYTEALKDYYKNYNRKLPDDFNQLGFGRAVTETYAHSLPEDARWIDNNEDEDYLQVVNPKTKSKIHFDYPMDDWGGYYSKSNSIGKEFSFKIVTSAFYLIGSSDYSNWDIPNDKNMSYEEFNAFFDDNYPDLGHHPRDCDFWTMSMEFKLKNYEPIKCVPIFESNDSFDIFSDVEYIIAPNYNGSDIQLHYSDTNIMNPFTGEFIPVWLITDESGGSGTYFHNYNIGKNVNDDKTIYFGDDEFKFYLQNIKKYGKK